MEAQDSLVRAIKIIQRLSARKKMTVKELYNYFDGNVGIRTLQRDLNKISEAGIPLFSEKSIGNENVWFLDSQFTGSVFLPISLNEYMVASYLKKALPVFKNTPLEKEYSDLVDKLDQFLPSDSFDILFANDNAIDENFEALEFGTFDYSKYSDLIKKVLYGIEKRLICNVTYKSPENPEAKSFEIEPYKILLFNGAMYLVVFNRKYKEFNHLSLNRIKELEATDKVFKNDQDYENEQFVKDRFGLTSLPAEKIELLVDQSTVPYIEGRIWHRSQKTSLDKNGSMTISMMVSISDDLIGWILRWQGGITVLKSDKLKKKILDSLENMKIKFR